MIDPEELVERRKAAKAARTAAAPQFDGRRLVALGRGDGRSYAELAALSGLPESEVRRRIAAELAAEAEDRASGSGPSRANLTPAAPRGGGAPAGSVTVRPGPFLPLPIQPSDAAATAAAAFPSGLVAARGAFPPTPTRP